VVTGTQTVAGIVGRIGNGGLFYGRSGSVTKKTNVDLSQTVAGIGNAGIQALHLVSCALAVLIVRDGAAPR